MWDLQDQNEGFQGLHRTPHRGKAGHGGNAIAVAGAMGGDAVVEVPGWQ